MSPGKMNRTKSDKQRHWVAGRCLKVGLKKAVKKKKKAGIPEERAIET